MTINANTDIKDLSKEDIIKLFAEKGTGVSQQKATEMQSAPSLITSAETGVKETPEVEASAEDQSIDNFNKYQVALNVAIDEARKVRKDVVMDTVGGMIPSGALPATSFSGILKAFNSDARPVEASLLTGAMNNARDMEDRKFKLAQEEKDQVQAEKNFIQELSMSVASETGDVKTAEMIMSAPDRESAIKMSLAALGKDYTVKNGSIVKPTSGDADDEVVYDLNKFMNDNFPKERSPYWKTSDLFPPKQEESTASISLSKMDFMGKKESGTFSVHMNFVKEEGIKIMGAQNYKRIDEMTGMTDFWMRQFMNDWVAMQERMTGPLDAWTYFSMPNGWAESNTAIDLNKKKDDKEVLTVDSVLDIEPR